MFNVLWCFVVCCWSILMIALAYISIIVIAILDLIAKAIPFIIAGVALVALYHFFINQLW